jgi:hypothetical protein
LMVRTVVVDGGCPIGFPTVSEEWDRRRHEVGFRGEQIEREMMTARMMVVVTDKDGGGERTVMTEKREKRFAASLIERT